MAGSKEFEIFRMLYEEENRRFSELNNRAKLFLSIVSLVLGSLFLKLDLVLDLATGHPLLVVFLFITWVTLFAALIATLCSLRIRDFENICDPEVAANALDALEGKSEVHDYQGIDKTAVQLSQSEIESEFLSDRIADLVVATKRNTVQNDVRARWLASAGNLIVLAFACALTFLVVVLIIGLF